MNNSQKIELLKQTIEGIRQDIEKIKNVKIKIIIKKIETKKVFERERKKRK
jgi:Tfp pilus assembly protein PilN